MFYYIYKYNNKKNKRNEKVTIVINDFIHTCISKLLYTEDRAIGEFMSFTQIFKLELTLNLLVPTEVVPVRCEQVLARKSEIKYNTEKQV